MSAASPWQQRLTRSYFSLSFCAFSSYGCFSDWDSLLHISPSFFAQSPMDRPGYCCFTLGRYSLQNTKNADLQRETPGQRSEGHCPHTSHDHIKGCFYLKPSLMDGGQRTGTRRPPGPRQDDVGPPQSCGGHKVTHSGSGSDRVYWTWSSLGCGPRLLSDLRWSLGSVGVFPLAAPLSKALGGDVVPHLPVVTDLVGFGHVLETLLIPSRQSLKPQRYTSAKGAFRTLSPTPRGSRRQTDAVATATRSPAFPPGHRPPGPAELTFHLSEHFLENSAKLTDCSGFFFRCSSRHVWTKKAYADVFPFGLFTSLRIIVAA